MRHFCYDNFENIVNMFGCAGSGGAGSGGAGSGGAGSGGAEAAAQLIHTA